MRVKVNICQGPNCQKKGPFGLSAAKETLGDSSHPEISACNCLGNCINGPTVALDRDGKIEIMSFMNSKKIMDLITQLKHETE